jgi:DNA-binding MarR family transcriptional regulator
MTRKRLSRKRITEVLMQLTPAQSANLTAFRHHKKWTVPLMAAHLGVDQSTANRRLRALVQAGVLDRLQGGYRVTGGRSPDIYYLTCLGAAVLTRYLQLGGSYVEAPSVANPISNDHDLWVLELAIRLGRWDEMRHRERMTFDEYELYANEDGKGGRYEPTRRQLGLVPDLVLFGDDDADDPYFEVEQTTRYAHILEKCNRYYFLISAYAAERRGRLFHLHIVFGNERQERALVPEHVRALEETELFYVPITTHTNMDAIREKDVTSLADFLEIVETF